MQNVSSSHRDSQQYLFLAGIGRSGTTILRRSLGLHPEIYYNGKENNLVQDILEVAKNNCTLKSRVHAMVVDQSTYDAQFHQLLDQLLWPDAELRERKIHMAAINPTGDLLGYLLQLFPNAKVLGLVRNGIQVISSRSKYRSFAQSNLEQNCSVWMRTASVFEWGANNTDRFREFRHEWMYSDTLAEKFREIFDWLSIGWSPEVVENINVVIAHPTSETGKAFSEMSLAEKAAYFQSKTDQWKEWPDESRQHFAKTCGEFMRQLGYELPF